MLKLLIPILLLLTGTVRAAIDFNQNISSIQNEIFNLRFDKARKMIEAEKKLRPQNTAVIACESTLDFFRAFLSEQQSDFDRIKELSSSRLSIIEKENPSSPFYLHMQAEIIFQRAIMKALNGETLSAGLDTRKAFKMFEENHEKYPGFKPTLKGLGLLHVMIGSIPQNYRWIANLAGLSGTINQGIAELKDLVNETVSNKEQAYLKNETLLILIYIECHYGKNMSHAYELMKLYDNDNNSQLVTFSIANLYAMDGKNELLLETLSKLKYDPEAYPLHYLKFMMGMGRINKLDLSAADHFSRFVDGCRCNRFVKSAYQKIAWSALINNDTAAYNKYMKVLLTAGSDFTDEDKHAQAEAKAGIRPNIHLLKARLLFDGGYYLQSLELLSGIPPEDLNSQKDKIEYVYRTARNFDLLNQKQRAITFYNNTITIGGTSTYYFAANAALNIAQIYETQKDTSNAIAFYKKCLEMRNHEYQNSIDQKAKAGLNRLGAD